MNSTTTDTRTIPTIPTADVASHNTENSCYVSIGAKVYDVTSFLSDHPGGGELIVEYGGKDVSKIMKNEMAHAHSEAAWEILEEHFVGYQATDKVMDVVTSDQHAEDIVPFPPNAAGMQKLKDARTVDGKTVYATTGMTGAEDLSRDTDFKADYKAHKFLDLDRPLLMQVWNGGFSKDFYLEQVHRPRHYKGGASAPLFGNFLEPLSKTSWWVIPLVWLPPVSYGTFLAATNLGTPLEAVSYWILGLFLWTLVEYGLHRFLFHIEVALPDNRVGITLHFLLHGIHHYLPMDKLRLVMPPTLFVVLAIPFWQLAHTLFAHNWYIATDVFCGGIFGYICYDLTHYSLHHRK